MNLLWDVDGTLVENAPDGVDLYSAAIQDVIGVLVSEPPVRHGKTDRQILLEYLAIAGGAAAELARVAQRLETLSQERYRAPKTARSALPGAMQALVDAAAMGFRNGLLTGNSLGRSEAKLAGAGFQLGSFAWQESFFGSDYPTRPAMARAAGRAIQRGVVIGDTPGDGEAAIVGGFAFVGVTTGAYDKVDLAPYGPVVVLDDLAAQSEEFLDALSRIDAVGGSPKQRRLDRPTVPPPCV